MANPNQLRALQDFDPGILVSLMKRLLPDPLDSSPDPLLSDMSAGEVEALRQIVQELGATTEQLVASARLRTEVLRKISSVLSNSIVEGERGRAAAQRLGSRGELRLALYRFKYSELLREFEALGIRKQNVEEVIRSPDSVQHLAAASLPPGKFPAVSLIAKRITPKRNPSFITLVLAERRDNELIVQSAWRLPEHMAVSVESRPEGSSEGRASRGATLLDILREFVLEFGLFISVPNNEPRKLLLNEAVSLGDSELSEIIAIDNPTNEAALPSFILRVSDQNVAQIAVGFAINIERYKRELRIEA